jgi:hypothetical protein
MSHDLVEPGALAGNLVQEVRLFGDHARLEVETATLPQELVAQVQRQMVQREHPHVTLEAVNHGCRAALLDHRIEDVPGAVEVALRRDGALEAEGVDPLVEWPLEAAGELARVVASSAVRELAALDEQDPRPGIAQREERGRDPGDARAHDRHVGARVTEQRARFACLQQLEPRSVLEPHCANLAATQSSRQQMLAAIVVESDGAA